MKPLIDKNIIAKEKQIDKAKSLLVTLKKEINKNTAETEPKFQVQPQEIKQKEATQPQETITVSTADMLTEWINNKFLSSLNEKWLNVELQSNWTYELDFVWFNNNSLSFHWNNVILTVDNINKTFLLDIWTPKNLKKALDTIDNVDKLLEVKKEITRIKHNTTWVRIWLGESEKEEKRLEKDLGIN